MALHPEVRRTLRRLGASFAMAYLAFAMTAGPGPAAFVALSGNLGDAGLYFALFVLSSAGGAGAGGALMDLRGRRPVLLAAHVLMTLGYLLMGLALQRGALVWFIGGIALAGVGMGAAFLSRLAAADLFPPAERGRGVAWVLVSATAGAVAGPLLLIASEPLGALLGRDPAALVWLFAPPLLLVSTGLVATMPEP
ncbi:MAG TPA: MFS transporter, partial [Candidatus Thermoplasmatota archaeon]|nr:MFS transporter [Candidatus Thermoplasmatota archaeon]